MLQDIVATWEQKTAEKCGPASRPQPLRRFRMSEKVRLRKFGFRLVIMLAFVFLFGAVTVWASSPKARLEGTLKVTRDGNKVNLLLTITPASGNESSFTPDGTAIFEYSTSEDIWTAIDGSLQSLSDEHTASASMTMTPGKLF